MSKVIDKIKEFIINSSSIFTTLAVILIVVIIAWIIIIIGNSLVEMIDLQEWLKTPISGIDVLDIIVLGVLFKLFGVFNSKVEVKK